MASITIRNLDVELKARLCLRAAFYGRSLEEEARNILRFALMNREPAGPGSLVSSIRVRFTRVGGVELPLVPREPMREPAFEP
jgi:antitoxin FitA